MATRRKISRAAPYRYEKGELVTSDAYGSLAGAILFGERFTRALA